MQLMTDIQKNTEEDYAYAAIQAASNILPVIGPTLLGLIIASPVERRLQTFREEVEVRLRQLEARGLDLQSLSSNDEFIDAVMQASYIALKTSEREKLNALKNAISNIAVGTSIEKTLCQIFLNLIDTFTPWHIKILAFYDNPKNWFERNSKQIPEIKGEGSIVNILFEAYPELNNRTDTVYLIWSDLQNAGLCDKHIDLNITMPLEGMLQHRISGLGRFFLEFITFSES